MSVVWEESIIIILYNNNNNNKSNNDNMILVVKVNNFTIDTSIQRMMVWLGRQKKDAQYSLQ
jgi:hypothetical protein